MSDTALLVLDMVNRFDFEGGDRLAKAARAIVPRIESLRARFDAAGAPTIYVNDNFSHWQGQFGDLVAACREAGGQTRRQTRACGQAGCPAPAAGALGGQGRGRNDAH